MLSAYPAIFHKEEGVFWVEFPDLPGCYTTGDDISEVLESAQEALGLYLATQIESEVVPESPTDIRSISLNDETSFVSLVACDVSHYIPNAETLEAMEEAERIKSGEQPSKGYTDFDEMMKDMLSD